MKKLISVLVVLTMALATSGCETDQERELRLERNHQVKMAKIESGQDAIEQEMLHERKMAYIQRPVAPGSYIDYRGNTAYGYWDDGYWVWNNPQSRYAMESRSYVDYQIATGVVVGAVLTQAMWNSNNRGGWKNTSITVNNYTTVNGKTMTKAAYKAKTKKLNKKLSKNKKTSPAVSKTTGNKESKWSKTRTKSSYADKKPSNIHKKNSHKSSIRKSDKRVTRKPPVKTQKKRKPQKTKSSRKY